MCDNSGMTDPSNISLGTMFYGEILKSLFREVGLTTDVPLPSPMITTGYPIGDADGITQQKMPATLPMNMDPEGVRLFMKRLAQYQGLTSIQTRWGKGYYRCTGDAAAFLVEQIDGYPGDRLEFKIGPTIIAQREGVEANERLRSFLEYPDTTLDQFYEPSFGVSFTYVRGNEMILTQIAKLTPGSDFLGFGAYYLFFKTALLRKIADLMQTDQHLHRIVAALESGRRRELVDEDITTDQPIKQNKVLDRALFFTIQAFTPKCYFREISPAIKNLVRGAATLVPNLFAIVPPASYVH